MRLLVYKVACGGFLQAFSCMSSDELGGDGTDEVSVVSNTDRWVVIYLFECFR